MKIISPAYYRDFQCIASACRHNCCIGWEVDIDEKTLALYEAMPAPLGSSIRDSIDRTDVPHFKLVQDERCPHLSSSGLCKIICECGEGALCQICRDHPRYRNFYDGVIELGLGLSCEEVSKLVVSHNSHLGFFVSDSEDMSDAAYHPDYPVELFSVEERGLAEEKRRLIELALNSSLSINERLASLLPKLPDVEELRSLLLSLEILDDEWRRILNAISANDFVADLDKYSESAERFLAALMFRHITAESFYEPRTIAAFAALSTYIIVAVASVTGDLADAARAYSAEIEYSLENTEALLDFIEEAIL